MPHTLSSCSLATVSGSQTRGGGRGLQKLRPKKHVSGSEQQDFLNMLNLLKKVHFPWILAV